MPDSDVALLEKTGRNGHSDYTPEQMALITRTVAKGATPDELALYLHDCQRRGVHPLDRLLHFTVRQDHKSKERRYTPIVSIDLFRSRAASSGEYAGSDDAVHVTEAETEYPQLSTVTVWRIVQGHRCPFTATARWKEYRPTTNDFMWSKMPYTMLGKCAEALALRKAFPAELGGLYTAEEMAQAGPAIDPEMTAECNGGSPEDRAAARKAGEANPKPPPKPTATQQQYDAFTAIVADLEIPGPEVVEMFKAAKVKRFSHLTEKNAAAMVLDLCKKQVKKLLTELQFNLDDVRAEAPSVTADTADELDQDQANAVLGVLRAVKRRQEG